MKKLLLILLCLPMIGFGQGWEKTFGGTDDDCGYSVQQTNDGGYIITGAASATQGPNSNSDVYLIKTDGSGNVQWSKTFGGTGFNQGYSVQQTNDGGYIITGYKTSSGFGNSGVYLIKTDGNGNELWSNTFGALNDKGNSIKQTTDGGYIIAGSKRINSYVSDSDIYLIKTDGNGNELWSQTFGQPHSGGTYNWDYGRSVQQTLDGGYVIAGTSRSFGGNILYQPFLIKTDGNGNEQWTKSFGGMYWDGGSEEVQLTSDGGFILIGYVQLTDTSFNEDIYLIKTDGNGNEQWTKTFGGTSSLENGSSIKQTTDGGYIIAGSVGTGPIFDNVYDVILMKTNSIGDSLWTKTFGGIEDDYGNSVQQTNDGGYIITGETSSFGNGDKDVYLIKTDANGNVTSTFNIPINSNRKLQKTVDLLGRESKPQKNVPFIEIYDDGTVEKKITID